MVEVEKITYSPLIYHLQKDESYYQHLLIDHEIKHGRVDGSIIIPWMVNVIQPIVIKTCGNDDGKISRVTRAFFKELIKQKANGNIILYANAYERLWKVLLNCPDLLSSQPTKMLKALSSAFQTINRYIPENIKPWIDIMDEIAAECHSWQEFIAVGRIAAWMVGLAMIREQALQSYLTLPNGVQQKLQTVFPSGISLKKGLSKSWVFYGDKTSNSFGGFIGYEGGTFELPPVLFYQDENVFATDGRHHYALFVDVCGSTMVRDIKRQYTISQTPKILENHLSRSIRKQYDDICSLLIIESSVVFTRKSSFKVYLRSECE